MTMNPTFLEPGTKVEVFGLANDVDLNGQTATVVRFEGEKKRYVLRMDSTWKGKAIAAVNVRVV